MGSGESFSARIASQAARHTHSKTSNRTFTREDIAHAAVLANGEITHPGKVAGRRNECCDGLLFPPEQVPASQNFRGRQDVFSRISGAQG
jgi:hypothetical protein